MSRPKIFDGDPVSIRLSQTLHDELCKEALRRDVDLAVVIRERLAVSQNPPHAETSAQ